MFISTQESSGGGHIGLNGKSLCGIEKRFPRMDHEQDHEDDEFAPWFKLNAQWICITCKRSYLKKSDIYSPRPTPPPSQ